jgi:hypothetical protein
MKVQTFSSIPSAPRPLSPTHAHTGKQPEIRHTTYLSEGFIKTTPQRYNDVKSVVTKTLTTLFGEEQVQQKVLVPKPNSALERLSFISHLWKVSPKQHHGAGSSSKGVLLLHNGGIGEPSRLITHMQYGTMEPGQLWNGSLLTKRLGARMVDNISELITERELINLKLRRMMGEKPSQPVWERITQHDELPPR